LLSVKDLRVYFRTRSDPIRAVDGVSFDVAEGETVAMVGESGCGKSVTALSLAGLVALPAYNAGGEILFDGRDTANLGLAELQKIRGAEISYIFQEPSQSLNPVFTVGYQIMEALRLHRGNLKHRNFKLHVGRELARRRFASDSERPSQAKALHGTWTTVAALPPNSNFREETIRLLDMVGIVDPVRRFKSYPHELSGGMQQRVMIAMALACRPKLLVADEPTTALDVTVQAQIMDLLVRLQGELGMAILLITHNLGLVADVARRVNVMYAGRIIESGLADEILSCPKHPYTHGLLAAVPRLDFNQKRMNGIPGNVPNPANPPAGCKFHPRCPHVREICRREEPCEEKISETHGVKCHFWKSIICG